MMFRAETFAVNEGASASLRTAGMIPLTVSSSESFSTMETIEPQAESLTIVSSNWHKFSRRATMGWNLLMCTGYSDPTVELIANITSSSSFGINAN